MKNKITIITVIILCFMLMPKRSIAQGVSVSESSLEWESASTTTKSFMVYSSSPWQMDTASVSSHFNISPMLGSGNTQVNVTPNTQNTGTEDILHLISIEGVNGGGAMVYLTHHCATSPGGGGSGVNNQGGNNHGGNGNNGGVSLWPATLEWSSHDLSAKLATITLANGGIWDADTSYMSSPFSLSAGTGVSGDGLYISPKSINHSTEDVTDSFYFEARSGSGGALLNLIQHGVVYSLETSPSEIIWDVDSLSDRTVTVTAFGDWSVSVSGQGFTVTGGSGLDDGSFTVHPTGLYYGRGDRTATLTVTCHGISRTVNLVQKRSDQKFGIAGNWTLKRSQYGTGSSAYNDDIIFYNGLGYAEQTVLVGASPYQSKNIVTPVVYDAMMRGDARSYLPYVSSGTTAVEVTPSTAITDQASWYNTRYAGEGQYASAVKVYESSPLNRVLHERKAGQAHASAGRMVRLGYDTNAQNEVLRLSVNGSGSLVANGYYAAGTLFKETVTDEDSSVVITFKDKQDRVMLVRENGYDTYSAYDARGYLSWMVSPEGSALLTTSSIWTVPDTTDINCSTAAKYCFIYENNGMGWPVRRKMPGRAEETLVYDAAGRVVRSQDGALRADGNKWLIIQYDSLGRETCRGVSSEPQAQAGIIEAVLARTIYGSYAGVDEDLGFISPSQGSTSISADLLHIGGLKTYEKVYMLEGSSGEYAERAFYYDADGRHCQTVELYPDGSLVRTSFKYDFAGNVTNRVEEQCGPDEMNHCMITSYTYDRRGRLTGSSRTLDGETLAPVAYSYDALGRLSGKSFSGNNNTGTETMSYDIRGWLIGSAASYGNSSVFSETLSYMMPAKPGTTGKYDGSISEITVTTPSVTETYGYSYDIHKRLIGASHYIGANSTVESNTSTEKEMTYDRNGNMTGIKRYFTNGSHDELAFTHVGNRLMQWSNANNETGGYLYDDNGNRKNDGGNNLSISYNIANLPSSAIKTVMSQSDTVTYRYLADGTKVSALMNDGGGLKYRGSFVYEVTAEPVDWYDDLGNYITDPILWNALSSVAWDEGRIVVENMFVVDTLAVDEPLLRGHEPEVADSTEVGGFAGALFDEWHVRDHLGSTRAVVYLNLGLGGVQDVIERYDYHPYGKSIPTSMENSSTRHRFSGKEEQRFGFDIFNNEYKTDHGLLDFGARYYDPFSCRWTTPDPLAEKYPAISPYAYCANNPVNLVDPKGKNIYYFDEEGNLVHIEERSGINRLAITSRDGNGNTHFQFYDFADPVNDPKDIDKGTITNILFIDDTAILGFLNNQFAFDNIDGIKGFIKSSNSLEIGDVPRYDYTASTLFDKYDGFIKDQETKSKYLFLVKGERFAHNLMNFGNYLWAATGYTYGVPILGLMLGAQANSLGFFTKNEYDPQFDSLDDQLSIFLGARHAAKNNYRSKRQKR